MERPGDKEVPVIPVDQLKLHDENTVGDCFRACLASILEMDPSDVPHFVELGGDKWWILATEWCEENGLSLTYSFKANGIREHLPLYWIASGKSPRGDFNHSVVFFGDEMVHDPHPSRDGIEGLPTFCYEVTLK